jgi:2-polyprenyl-3-methyl-5-hydroxy-6-metoxy-1,4-benzoquinol methylase
MGKCILCKKDNWHEYCKIENGRYKVLVCKNCSLSKLDPLPTTEELNEFYSERYRKQYSKQNDVSEDVVKYEQWRANQVVEIIKPFFKTKYKTVLDIGCSSGTLLKSINELSSGLELHGIELNDNYREYIVENKIARKENISNADISNFYKGNEEKFDFISIVHVLEHLGKPKKALESINKLLKDEGTLYIEVPNMKTPYNNLENEYFAMYHLYNFTDYTLENLLIDCGFKLVAKKMVNKTSIAFVCRKSDENLDYEKFNGEQFEIVLEMLKKYKKQYPYKILKSKVSKAIRYEKIKKKLNRS